MFVPKRLSYLPLAPENDAPDDWGEQIVCAVCGDPYVYPEFVRESGPQDNYESGWVRGSTITVDFCCENGGHTFSIEFGVHKGNTYCRLNPTTGLKG